MKNTTTINPVALANTLSILDLVGHPLIHLWVAIHPQSYEYLMQIFVAGLRLQVDQAFELAPHNLLLSTVLEASTFWALGYIGATVYNVFNRPKKK